MRGSVVAKVLTKTTLPTYVFLLIPLSLACSSGTITQNNLPGAQVNDVQRTRTHNQNKQLQTQLDQMASAAKGKVGVAAVVLGTRGTGLLNSHHHFSMQRVYKLSIIIAGD